MLTRWLVLLLLFVIVRLLADMPVWPPSLASTPIVLVVWCYAAFSLLATLALIIEPLGAIRRFALAGDIVAISLLVLYSSDYSDLFFPFYLLPLIGVAMQSPARRSLLIGMITAAAYIVAILVGRLGAGDATAIPSDMLELVSLTLHSAMLICIPWLASALAERSGIINRRSVTTCRARD